MPAQYQWKKDGPAPDVDAQIVGDILEGIAADQTMVAPKSFVDFARPAKSPIHHIFKWNDKEAGELYRIEQARGFIRALQIVRVEVSPGQSISNRAFFSVQMEKRGYVPHQRVLNDVDLNKQVIDDACKELETFIRKFGTIIPLGTNVVQHVQEAINEMQQTAQGLAFGATRRPSKGSHDGAGAGDGAHATA